MIPSNEGTTLEATGGDGELDAWRAEWRSLGATEDFTRSVAERAARDGRRMGRAAAGEVLAAALSSALCAAMIVHKHGALDVVAICAVVLVFNGAWLTHFFTSRTALFPSYGAGLDAFVALTRRRLDAELRWLGYARRWTLALAALAAPWSLWVLVAHGEAYRAAPWRAVVGFGGAALIFAGVLLTSRLKERSLRAERDRFERAVADSLAQTS